MTVAEKSERQLAWENAARTEARRGNDVTAGLFTLLAQPNEEEAAAARRATLAVPDVTKTGDREYAVEHSDFGLPPGVWPDRLTVEVDGLACAFDRRERMTRDGEFAGFMYVSPAARRPARLIVFND